MLTERRHASTLPADDPGARARPAATDRYYPTAVIAVRPTRVTLGLELSAHDRFAYEFLGPDDSPNRAVYAATSELVDLARAVGTPVRVLIDDAALRSIVRFVVAEVDEAPVIVCERATGQTSRLLVDVAEMHETKHATAGATPLVLGTDGSADRRRGSWAYVGPEGHRDWGVVPDADIGVCELTALREAVAAAESRDVLVLTDSRASLQALRRGVANRSMMRVAHAVRAIARERGAVGATTRIAWVPGHAGVELNEAAHRLALAALRQAQFRLGRALTAQVAERVLDELGPGRSVRLASRWTLDLS